MEPAKVLFISTWINNPELIPIQRDLIKKYCKEDADLLVILDGKTVPCFTNFGDPSVRQKQIDICRANNINFIEVPPELHMEPDRCKLFTTNNHAVYNTNMRNYIHDPSSRTAVSNQLGWNTFHKYLRSKYQYLAMIQSDMFPFVPFSVKEMLNGNSLLYRDDIRENIRGNLHYAWDGILMFDFAVQPDIDWNEWNFDSGFQQDDIFADTGGGTWMILKKIINKKDVYRKACLKWTISDPFLETLPEELRAFIKTDIKNEGENIYAEIFDSSFLHLRGGGNWEFVPHVKNDAWRIGMEKQQARIPLFIKTALELLI